MTKLKTVSYFAARLALLAAAALLLEGCTNYGRELSRKLKELDYVMEHSDVYEAEYQYRMDSLKRELAREGRDTARWNIAEKIVSETKNNNFDSSLVYVNVMYENLGSPEKDPEGYCRRKLISDSYRLMSIKYSYEAEVAYSTIIEKMVVPEKMDYLTEKRYFASMYMTYGKMLLLHPGDSLIIAKRNTVMEDLERRDTTSQFSQSRRAKWKLDQGDIAEAERLAGLSAAHEGNSVHAMAVVLNYLGLAAARQGREEEACLWWAEASIYAYKTPVKNHDSVYNLARQLHKMGDLRRATRYMDRAISDASRCNYITRLSSAKSSQLMISETMMETEKMRTQLLISGILLLTAALVVVILSRRSVSRTNAKLEEAVANLNNVNRIKEIFLTEYMEMSSSYIMKVDEVRSQLRRTAKEKGVDEMMAMLKTASFADKEYTNFYSTFDKAFLGMYPNFITEVNRLLDGEHQLALLPDGSLTTETRILALIRLGIRETKDISKILNMSINTIYSYRYRLRKSALCPPDDFEKKIVTIGL